MMISDILSKDVEVVNPETPATEIAMAMRDRNCGSTQRSHGVDLNLHQQLEK